MRVLGLDVGDRRLGIAISDETGTIASPSGVYERRSFSQDLAHLADLIHELGVERIVVGLPLNMDGTEGEQAAKVRAFAQALADGIGLPVELLDERLTTVEAERVIAYSGIAKQKKRQLKDALAAVLLLQAWLDRRRSSG